MKRPGREGEDGKGFPGMTNELAKTRAELSLRAATLFLCYLLFSFAGCHFVSTSYAVTHILLSAVLASRARFDRGRAGHERSRAIERIMSLSRGRRGREKLAKHDE